RPLLLWLAQVFYTSRSSTVRIPLRCCTTCCTSGTLGSKGVFMSNATKNIGIRTPVELKSRMARPAASTGRRRTYYLLRTMEGHPSETEYIYGLERDAEAVRRGELKTRPLDELWDELGIEPSDDHGDLH